MRRPKPLFKKEEKKSKLMKYAIQINNVSKTYKTSSKSNLTLKQRLSGVFSSTRTKEIQALKNISLNINKGETFGIIGRNGSGKSTLLNIIMGSIPPDKGGIVKTNGKIMRLALGLGIDPNLSARDNIYVNGTVLGLSFRQIGEIFDQILEFSGLSEFVDTPVKHFSSGMKQRLMFSIAMHAKADTFLLDEFFGGTGDDDFRKKSDAAFQNKIIEGNTIVIVSHSMAIISKYCTRVAWIHKGELMTIDSPENSIKKYRNFFAQ